MDLNDDTLTTSTRAFALSAGLLVAVACFCGVAAPEDGGCMTVICSPLFLGALAGAFAFQRPISNAIVTILLAVLLIWMAVSESSFYFFAALPILLAWSIPIAILGAICGASIRRWFRRLPKGATS